MIELTKMNRFWQERQQMKEKRYHYELLKEEQIQEKQKEDESYERIKDLLFYWAKNNQDQPTLKIKRIERVEIDRNFDL